MSTRPYYYYLVTTKNTRGVTEHYPYKAQDINTARRRADNRADVYEVTDAIRITEEEYKKCLKHLKSNTRDTSKRLSS